jgi:S-(hydroxymethyl)glutathione dehydrogenase/alcohol dehydrogenase
MHSRTFRAAVLEKINGELTLENLEVPDLHRGQVLVRVLYTSICASQIFEITGGRGEDPYLPHLLGHEGYGEVIQIGEGVERFRLGDRVILTWIKQKGIECKPIIFRTINNKLINAGRVTTFSELTVVSENRLFHAPEISKEETLPLLGCAALTGAGMVYGSVEELDRVLVIGAGGVGLFSILALLETDIKHIEVIEKSTNRAIQIRDLSPRIQVYKSFTDNLFIREIESNGNFSLIYEASGNLAALQSSIEFMSKKGRLVFASHPVKGKKIALDPYELIQGKVIRGSWGGGCEDLNLRQKVTELFARKTNTISEFISNPFPLSSINAAIDVAKNSGEKRVIIGMLE